MTRTPVGHKQLATFIATQLNGQTLNGGTLLAVAVDTSVDVRAQHDAEGSSYNDTFEIQVR